MYLPLFWWQYSTPTSQLQNSLCQSSSPAHNSQLAAVYLQKFYLSMELYSYPMWRLPSLRVRLLFVLLIESPPTPHTPTNNCRDLFQWLGLPTDSYCCYWSQALFNSVQEYEDLSGSGSWLDVFQYHLPGHIFMFLLQLSYLAPHCSLAMLWSYRCRCKVELRVYENMTLSH